MTRIEPIPRAMSTPPDHLSQPWNTGSLPESLTRKSGTGQL